MIKHILKIIWTERKVNMWILLELTLVFCILWFCTDYLSYMVKQYMEPKGFDIEHTYRIDIGMKDEGRVIASTGSDDEKESMSNDIWTIFDRIKKYPAVENVSFSRNSSMYSGSYSSNTFFVDTTNTLSQVKRITPEFFDVFKIKIISGTPFNDENIIVGDPVIISAGQDNLFGPKPADKVDYIKYEDDSKRKVIGVANKVKRSEYDNYGPILYNPVKRGNVSFISWREMCIRVKPDADKNFIKQFTKDMQSRLEIGHYFLASVIPIEKDREDYLKMAGYSDNFKSIYSVTAFLIINIFLGVIGTFWFRTQSRQNEIGLRIAIGASKKNVQRMFVGETLLLLFMASIVAAIISINVTMVDVLKDIGVPTIDRSENGVGISQYFINYGITFLFLAVIAVIAVWYPAMRASKIQPAEALHNE